MVCEDDAILSMFQLPGAEVTPTKMIERVKGLLCKSPRASVYLNWAVSSDKELINGKDLRVFVSSIDKDPEEGHLMANSQNHIAKHIKKVNESYFGSYSSFSIHRQMLSDKVRMDAYGQAILKNPSLLNDPVLMYVGCGTGILR